MTTQGAAPIPSLDHQTRSRLETLGLLCAAVRLDGEAIACDILTAGTDAHALQPLIDSSAFAAAIRDAFGDLVAGQTKSLDPLPGLRAVAIQADPQAITLALWRWDQPGAEQPASPNAPAPRSADQTEELTHALSWVADDTGYRHRTDEALLGLSSELSETYEELSLLYKLSSGMTVDQPASRFLREAMAELRQTTGLGWLALLLSPDNRQLNQLRGAMFDDGKSPIDRVKLVHTAKQLLSIVEGDSNPLILSADKLKEAGIDPIADPLLAVPVKQNETTLGIIIGADKPDGGEVSSIDAKLCHALGSTLSIFVDNTMLYDSMQQMFLGTLHALTSAIDAKDSYTHGHSERVALMSRMLAEAMGFNAEDAERVHLSGLVHDVGKIGVPEAVLCKNGPLTDEEFGLIRKHPEIGAQILRDIPQMQDLLPGVLHHHERWDGRGYPHKLAGDEIPVMGRIIGLADAFDAMSSNRTYRKALHPTEVRVEIAKNAGKQFDPEVVEAFNNLDLTPVLELVNRHQRQLAEEEKAKTHAA
ncbi:MAG: HD-GYP domain-containing protein [Planctomycetota bacterium]